MFILNFENSKNLNRIFEKDLNPERIIRELSVFSGSTILEKETLIIFDEIQASEKALTSLKYFYDEKSLIMILYVQEAF